MPRKKILVLLHTFQLGGAEILACQLVRALRSSYDFIIASLDGTGPLQESLTQLGVPVFSLCRRPGIDLALVVQLFRLLRLYKCDLIHAHQYTPFAYALLARSLYHSIPILFTEHGRFVPDQRQMRRVIANRLLCASKDRITAVSNSVRTALVVNEGLPSPRIAVVPNGVDTDFYSPAHNSDKLSIRARLGLPPDCFLVVNVARLDPVKDHFTAIFAFWHLYKTYPNSRLLLVGDGPERSRILAFLHEHGLRSVVLSLGQQINTLPYYHAADCFLLTSLSEGMPLTVLEAMSCALPVVSTACGAVPEIIEHGKTGFVAPVRDDVALGKYLIYLARHPEQRDVMGNMGRAVCLKQYTWSKVVCAYAEIYDHMLGIPLKSQRHDYFPVFC